MKIAVFGASGATGLEVLRQGLAQGHEMTAFVRDPASLAGLQSALRVVVGDTTGDGGRIAEAIAGQDAVVSALGRRRSFKSEGLIERSLAAISRAMEEANVRRLVVVSAMGVGDSHRDAPWLPRLMYRLLLADLFADKAVAEAALRAGRLEWTIVYPTVLTDGAASGRYRVGERLELHGLPKISRADVAHFILGELAHPAFIRKTAVVSQ